MGINDSMPYIFDMPYDTYDMSYLNLKNVLLNNNTYE